MKYQSNLPVLLCSDCRIFWFYLSVYHLGILAGATEYMRHCEIPTLRRRLECWFPQGRRRAFMEKSGGGGWNVGFPLGYRTIALMDKFGSLIVILNIIYNLSFLESVGICPHHEHHSFLPASCLQVSSCKMLEGAQWGYSFSPGHMPWLLHGMKICLLYLLLRFKQLYQVVNYYLHR